MEKVIGIDLGTTNSCVAIVENGTPVVIPNRGGYKTTPSMVAVTEAGKRLVGHIAKRQAITNAENTVYAAKRLIGRKWNSPQVKNAVATSSYKMVEGPHTDVRIVLRDKEYGVPEISAMVLQEMKVIAEDYLGEPVAKAVVTVPAYFNDNQRQATKDAGEIAGLKVERIINEPTAAALAYGLEKKKNARIAVFDLGGGTFDISILDVGDGVFEVLSSNGDGHLGGDDFDQRIINSLAEDFRKKEGIDIRSDAMALQRLKEAAEKAKIELSTQLETSVNLAYITADQNGPKHLQTTITRVGFESMCADLFARLRGPCEQAIRDSKLDPKDIEEVVMVGGSIRIPKVQDIAKEIFQAKALDRSINPDEVVAIGAAIQGGVLMGDVKDVLLLDVTPLSLGVETLGSVMTTLIPRNTTIPTSKKEVFSTASDGQTSVTIHVLQGERQFASDNRTLGRFDLTGIASAQRGAPQIEVEFALDANGILNVSATDKATNKKQEVKITGSSGLSKDEVERMKREAEENAASDKTRRELVDLKNQAEQLVYGTKKALADVGERVPAALRGTIESAAANLEERIKSDDKAAIEAAMKQLSDASVELGKIPVSEAGAAPKAETTENSTGSKKDDVIDADFEVKDA